jgi:hypothetical protein
MVLAVVAAGAVAVGAWTVVAESGEDNASGNGLDYRARFYGLSPAEVRGDRLGPFLARDIAFRDVATDLGLIGGVDADTAVAAWIEQAPGTAAEHRPAWLAMASDPDAAADPWSSPGVAPALRPPGRQCSRRTVLPPPEGAAGVQEGDAGTPQPSSIRVPVSP